MNHLTISDNIEDNGNLLIKDLFRIPDRYLKSIHIERDFHDVELLKQYILTPPMERSLFRIAEGLRTNSGRRAWRITGDYGSGKSSFALFLAHVLFNPHQQEVSLATKVINDANPGLLEHNILPILVTGSREGLVPAIARGIIWSLDWQKKELSRSKIFEQIYKDANRIITNGNPQELLNLIQTISVAKEYSGILLVLDEMGKFLEFAALYPDKEDLYLLQSLAEMAQRSKDNPIVLVGLLHQGFHAYAEQLPTTARNEWEKVAGRFDEIIFDQPLTHIVTLVSNALNVVTENLTQKITNSVNNVFNSTLAAGWYGSTGSILGELNILKLFPLHPTVLPVLINFFSRFGQHERSLFSFLLSSEPYGLQAFAERPLSSGEYYRLSNFYDYIRANFGHRLTGASFRSHWLRIVDILDSTETKSNAQLIILKTVAVLNLIDAEQLLPTDAALISTTTDGDPMGEVVTTINDLKANGLLYKRGAAGGYRLWASTSINLESRFEDAKRALGPLEQVAINLKPFLDVPSLLARRHYIKTGTLRYFEVRYTDLSSLRENIQKPTIADGIVIIALCDTQNEQHEANIFAQNTDASLRDDLIFGVPYPLIGLRNEVQDARCWEWVKSNAPELIDDSYAFAEVTREISASQRVLKNRLNALISFGNRNPNAAEIEIQWWRKGKKIEIDKGVGILQTLSDVCDELFYATPKIINELINRRVLSSTAANARLRLIERMFEAPNKPFLGINPDKAPPEKSIYLSVLKAGNLHREVDGSYLLGEPEENNDPLNLRTVLNFIISILEEANEKRVSVVTINEKLTSRPYGLRMGIIPLLIAIVIAGHLHELAIYENGTFVLNLDTSTFLRLIKAPGNFEFQLIKVAGLRLDLFNRLASVFIESQPLNREPELLDVVRSLIKFAAELPDYTKRTDKLTLNTSKVRNALLNAREPRPLLFRDLPIACGVEIFSNQDVPDFDRVEEFISLLQKAVLELRNAYPLLLERIRLKISNTLGEGKNNFDREQIANRASKIVVAAADMRLRTFAIRLSDLKLNANAWTEALGSYVIAKPVQNWLPGDEEKINLEIETLCETFKRLEAITFTFNNETDYGSAVRVGLTHSDGTETMQVVHVSSEIQNEITNKVSELQNLLPESDELRLAILVQLLEQSLKTKDKTKNQ